MPRLRWPAKYLTRRRWTVADARAALAAVDESGLSLNAFAARRGTPTVPGTFEFEVTVTDLGGSSATRGYSLRVHSSLSLDGVSVAAAVEGAEYEACCRLREARPPGCGGRVVRGELPPGLRLEDADQRVASLRGRPGPGRYLFTIAVVDGAGGRAEQDLELLVRSSLSIAAPAAPAGRTGRGYAWQLAVEGGLGQGIAWHVLNDALPPGLELAFAGTGPPTAGG